MSSYTSIPEIPLWDICPFVYKYRGRRGSNICILKASGVQPLSKCKLQMSLTEKRVHGDACHRRFCPLIKIPSGKVTYQLCQAPRYREVYKLPEYCPEQIGHNLYQ